MGSKARLFFDASTLIAAAGSPDGGSSLVIEFCVQGKAAALVTRLVLREAERNIRDKMGEHALVRFYELLAELGPEVIPPPSSDAIERAAELVADKDAHVLAGAREGRATHLITLDRKHLLPRTVRQGALPMIVCTPGDYLQDLLEEEGE